MKTFRELQARTYCPFAKKARVRFARDWNYSIGFSENIALQAADLRLFVQNQSELSLHGFISQIVIGHSANSFEAVKKSFAAYLYQLSLHDDSCMKCLSSDFTSRYWQFTFSEMRIFLNVFAPCYAEQHSKYVSSQDSFFILFQPEASFDICGIQRSSIATKESIRRVFEDNGSAYNADLIDARVEAAIYMFPMRLTDERVEWWRHLPEALQIGRGSQRRDL